MNAGDIVEVKQGECRDLRRADGWPTRGTLLRVERLASGTMYATVQCIGGGMVWGINAGELQVAQPGSRRWRRTAC